MTTNGNAVVYVVDDDDAVRDSLTALFESHDLNVESFGSGEDFLAAVGPERGGCLVLDLHLPIMSGLQILSRIGERKIGIPVIVITGGGDDKEMRMARESGASIVMEKPLDHRQLIANVQKAMAQN